ncbi:MAG: efflux RND transporter periplasmic adaptor subunit [Melioribacteraceae bacterium]|nr:efflux RND transporter periplasmic adaptor subunit [Melioribacteraceae bacterium]
MKQLINNKIFQFSFVLVIGLFFGWLLFSNGTADQENIHSEVESKETIWTCSMHPQIRQNEPGDCPICGMELIPLAEDEDNTEQNNFTHTMSSSAAALANIQTEQVKYQVPQNEIFLTGKIKSNEKNLSVITADYSGRLENLFIDFTGESVQKGEKLATIYSPELVSTQKELLEAAKTKDRNPSLYNAVKEKLRLWKITDEQIEQIESSNEIVTELDIYADISGIVLSREVSKGDYVNKGEILFEISDLSSVWVMLDAYESDLPWVKVGYKVEFTTQSLPGKTFTSTVTFVDPLINDQSRTASVQG